MRGVTLAALAGALLLPGCQRSLPELPASMIPEPSATEVETVLFIVGDAGNATEARSPLVHVMRADVERWARQLRTDTAVVVLFLGDNVYNDGMDAPDEPAYARDSTVLMAQVNIVGGPAARDRAHGFFMAGNHDWGNARDTEGVLRLREQEKFLDRQRVRGLPVQLLPAAGEPGPVTLEVGRQLTLLLYDTAWWLLASDERRKLRMIEETELALRRARSRDRIVVLAAHHPWQSASSHGGTVPFWKMFGLRLLLNRSGAILQDLNSVPYRELTRGLRDVFAAGPPLLFAGGHDHNLQVITNPGSNEPQWTMVSGSGSKLTDVGHIDGMRYRAAAPGYAKVYVRRDGHVDMLVVAAPGKDQLECGGTDDALASCMGEAIASFRPTYGVRLK